MWAHFPEQRLVIEPTGPQSPQVHRSTGPQVHRVHRSTGPHDSTGPQGPQSPQSPYSPQVHRSTESKGRAIPFNIHPHLPPPAMDEIFGGVPLNRSIFSKG